LRYLLKFKDGNVLRGKMIGEMGGSILLKPDSEDAVRIIHLSELSGAWEVGDDGTLSGGAVKSPIVTVDREFRLLDVDEVERLLSGDDADPDGGNPLPDFYYEISFRPGSVIISCDASMENISDLEVVKEGRTLSVLFISGGSLREIPIDVDVYPIDRPVLKENYGLVEIMIPVSS